MTVVAGFVPPRPVWLSRGEEAERYEGFDVVRAGGRGGCFAVVPFPFDLNEG